MKCHEVMKKVVQCGRAGETVSEVATRMRDCGIGFMPICDENGYPMGVVTDRDLVTRVIAAGRPCDTTPIEEVMSGDVISCRANDDLRAAEDLMGRFRKSRIVCTGRDGKLAGVISLSDVAEVEQREWVSTLLRSISSREYHPD